MTYRVTRVGTPSFRSVPGVLPEAVESLVISSKSSAIWNAIPIFSPNLVSISTTSGFAPDKRAPNLALVAINEPVLSDTTFK
ncbi:unannotated protein [freshwater metagenome]|uniref:Unannotated protein n=1 Tax=freshwater metagenome TaxID=449393 RepID=A0A6J6MGE5_9ZZZZ